MRFQRLVEARIVRRLNRFAVEVETGTGRVVAHLANSGRLHELLQPGTPAYLVPRDGPHRKTRFDLALVRVNGALVSADARLPNILVREALEEGRLKPFRRYSRIEREFRYGEGRFDFLLHGPGRRRCFVEVKSVTLVQGGRALFPDAPTLRGRRHVEDLARRGRRGSAAAVVFVIQREDARVFGPNASADPEFARALRKAQRVGVELLAYRCSVSTEQIRLLAAVPVSF